MKYFAYTLFYLCLLGLSACTEAPADPEPEGPVFSASGTAWDVVFTVFPPLHQAKISILEYPGKTTRADSSGKFHFDGLKPGSDVTFKLEQPNYYPYYSETFTMDSADLGPVAFQVPSNLLFAGFALISETVPQPGKGFIASTVSTADPATFVDLGFPGEPGCTVTIDPALPAACGPIYFDENTMPRRYLTETTGDGGILYVNVPPGEYIIYAHKTGIEFRPIRVKVFANSFTNAPPPYGLRKLR